FIFERPRPLSRQRRADDLYTLNCEEPQIYARPIVKRRGGFHFLRTASSFAGAASRRRSTIVDAAIEDTDHAKFEAKRKGGNAHRDGREGTC
ncbi:hypothetical protein ACJH6H_16145, partial [Mycobacterium sp. SMC-21]|uniref:hypothetical protein n=1 Tax=Mycobacterium sp. SMC-21 TaxID=3381632 RepID=UPI003876FE05